VQTTVIAMLKVKKQARQHLKEEPTEVTHVCWNYINLWSYVGVLFLNSLQHLYHLCRCSLKGSSQQW